MWIIVQVVGGRETERYLSDGNLSMPAGWDFKKYPAQAKSWSKAQNAGKWAAIGNEMLERLGSPTRLRVRPAFLWD